MKHLAVICEKVLRREETSGEKDYEAGEQQQDGFEALHGEILTREGFMKKRRVLLGMLIGVWGAAMKGFGQQATIVDAPTFQQIDPLMISISDAISFGFSVKQAQFIVRGDGREVRIGVKELMDILEGRDA